MTYPDSSSYDGGYKMDKRHGQGVYTYANGDTYAGGWANGVKHGKGCYFFQNKQCQFLGFWEASKFTAGTVRSWPRAEPLRRLPLRAECGCADRDVCASAVGVQGRNDLRRDV